MAAPPTVSKLKTALPIAWDEDDLEARWSWRGTLDFSDSSAKNASIWLGTETDSQLRLDLGRTFTKDKDLGDLSLALWPDNPKIKIWRARPRLSVGRAIGARKAKSAEIAVVRVGKTLRVLVNGHLALQTQTELPGARFGLSTAGWKWRGATMQPTESVTFRDDFMRASAPDEPEAPGEWKTSGVWKTSGTLGPRSDAALNPNPFVFRASGAAPNAARVGKWFWSDYVVSASIRAHQSDENAPLTASLAAFEQSDGRTIRGEIDFRNGVARIKIGEKILAQSQPFDAAPDEWHRVRLEPGPGSVRLLFDGVEVVRAKADLAQGSVVLRAVTKGANWVDFDDVRVGPALSGDKIWGEGALPTRFVNDRIMRGWASAAAAWKRDENGIWWHTGDFFGESQVSFTVPKWKSGQGVRVFLGADSKRELGSASAQLQRLFNGRYELVFPGSKVRGVSFDAAQIEGKTFSFKWERVGANWKLQAFLGDERKLETPISAPRGTQIGLLPTLNGQPLPPPRLRTLKISSPTFERDGRAVIGVNITPVTEEIQKTVGLPDANGAIVDNVETDSPAQKAGIQNGDVVRGVNGARVADVETMRGAVGAVKGGAMVELEILRPQSDGSGLNWNQCLATTPDVLDYSFTAAPVDWRPARGLWQVSERWTCSPQWSFFSGQNDESPLLWSRFALKGDWTLEAYLATPMDLSRGERSPSDINISIGDGKSVGSGYSFLFAAKNRENNQIRRGNALAWEKPFSMPAGVGDTHQDWFYCRLEKRTDKSGIHFLWSVNGREIARWSDANPIKTANHLAFWSVKGGLSIARVRLWHQGVNNGILAPKSVETPQSALKNAIGVWTPRGSGRDASARVTLVSDAGKPALEVVNPKNGGDWTLYATRQSFRAGVLEWDYRLNPNAKVNLYAKIAGQWHEITFSGGASTIEQNQPSLGQIQNVSSDGKWHRARFDFKSALASRGLSGAQIEALAFAAPQHDYLRAGLGGNAQGATYWLRGLKIAAS